MDYYSTLGVAKNASDKDLKAAYKKASMKHHPDRGGDEAKFKQINEAYSTLKDPQKRGIYDHQQTAGQGGFNFKQGGFEEAMRQANTQYGGGNPFAGSPFEDIFGNRQQQPRTPRNQDIRVKADITLQEVLSGTTKIIQYKTQTGRLETVNVDIPAGARHNDTIRYQGLGDDGHPRYPRGDLHVNIRCRKTKGWDRENNNLITKKEINVFDLLLGCVIIVETLDNRHIKLTIPKGTRPGQVFSIPGYGIPDLNTGTRGLIYIGIEALMPDTNDPEVIQLLEKLKQKVDNGRAK